MILVVFISSYKISQETKHSLKKGVLTNLQEACKYYEVKQGKAHRGLEDAEATAKIFIKQIKEWGKDSGFTSDLLPDE